MGFIKDTYNKAQTSPTMTDRYHFSTGQGYYFEGRANNHAISYMFGRTEAFGGGYTVAAGLEAVIDVVKRWQNHGLTKDDLAFLRSQKTPQGNNVYSWEYLNHLRRASFKLKIDAAPEGTLIFPQEPILRVEGPIEQVKILESVALCLMNGQSAYATHAARLIDVLTEPLENGSPVGEASVQGLRRGPGLGAAIEASRALGLGGYASTSTGKAAQKLGQKFTGTMDHAWVMTHENEIGPLTLPDLIELKKSGKQKELKNAMAQDAFRSYALANPAGGTFLLDTYHPEQGLENAITVINEMRALGLKGNWSVRFDSGDLVDYSRLAMRRFAQEGYFTGLSRSDVDAMDDDQLLKHSAKAEVNVAAADGIDEYSAKEMRARGCFVKYWGIGTGGSHVAPVGFVYKSAAIYMPQQNGKPMPADGKLTPVMKVAANAPAKSSNPGKVNSRRYYDDNGKLSRVVIFEESKGLDPQGGIVNLRDFTDTKNGTSTEKHQDLLVPVFDKYGRYIYKDPAKKPAYPGSRKKVTDLDAMAQYVRAQLDTLPANVRAVNRAQDDVRGKLLTAAFNKAVAAGQTELKIDIAEIEKQLPPKTSHIPVYLDNNLFLLRQEVEAKHLDKSRRANGVANYTERFAK